MPAESGEAVLREAAPFAFGGTNAVQVFLHDITERKRVEAERERLIAAIEQAGSSPPV